MNNNNTQNKKVKSNKTSSIKKVEKFDDVFNQETAPTSQETLSTTKEKIKVKSKRHQISQHDATRYDCDINFGLTSKIVEERIENGLTNKVKQRYNKSIFSIILAILSHFLTCFA